VGPRYTISSRGYHVPASGFGISCTDQDINEWWVANRPTAERRHCTTATACQLLHASYCIDITNRQVGIRILLAVISNAAGMLRVPSTIHRVPHTRTCEWMGVYVYVLEGYIVFPGCGAV
jgi:hypothetical protein